MFDDVRQSWRRFFSRPKRPQLLLLTIAAIGVVLLLIQSGFSVEPQPFSALPERSSLAMTQPVLGTTSAGRSDAPDPAPDATLAVWEQKTEDDVKRMMEQIVGVGWVDVVVTMESTPPVTTDRNVSRTSQTTTEQDAQGSKRNTTQSSTTQQSVVQPGSGGQRPAVTLIRRPSVRGVWVVAEGVEDKRVYALVYQSLKNGLGIAGHRIAIVPAKRSRP